MKIQIILVKNLLSVSFLMLLSCSDLVEEPVSQLSPEAIADEKGIESIVLGAYAHVASGELAGANLPMTIMLRSDMCNVVGTNANRVGINDFSAGDANTILTTVWNRFFKSISACNTAIAGAEGIEDEAGRNRVIGEARFMRAFAYYHLVRLFGPVPIVDFQVNTSESADALRELPRSSVDELYNNLIIPDLEFAEEWLPDSREGNGRTRATRGTAAGYLASVQLTRKNYQAAYEEAKFVIDHRENFGYALDPNFQDLFNAEKAAVVTEPLLTIAFSADYFQWPLGDDNLARYTGLSGKTSPSFRGASAIRPTVAVYESFDINDYRTQVSFQTELELENGDVAVYPDLPGGIAPLIAKFRRFPGRIKRPVARESDIDYIQMRYAEVLLIAAEALNQISGPTDEALGYINQIRRRARLADGDGIVEVRTEPADLPSGLSQEDFHDAVIEERRIELAFEYKRWYDIKRLDLGEEVFKGTDSYEPHPEFNQNHYLFKIPFTQLNFNPGWEQNP